jgi:hypothetical protein
MLRSMGMAYNEVVVALLDEPGSTQSLRRFTVILTGIATLLLLIITATPLADIWFRQLQGLSPRLADLALAGMWIALPMPGLNVIQSWFQGVILHGQRTRGITEAVVVFLVTAGVILWGGVIWGAITGLFVGLAAFDIAMLAQTLLLWHRSRPALQAAAERDEQLRFLHSIPID